MALQSYDVQTERPVSNAFSAGLNKLVAQALAEKSLVWFSAMGSLSLWWWAMLHPEPLRLGAAAGYTVLSYIPMIWRK